MSDPHDAWLADAVDAARECARDDSPAMLEGAATRSRIHASLERRRGTSKRRLTLISAVLASMFGSTAFAYYSGWRPFSPAPEPARAVSTIEPEAPAHRPHTRTGAGSSEEEVPPPIEPVAPLVVPPPAPSITTPPPAPTPAPTPSPTRRPAAPARSATTPTPTPPTPAPAELTPPVPEVVPAPPAPDAELVAYQQAHDAHFKGNDPAAALAAWDRYLAQFPAGKLAPEARYDRALVLVKLARWNEAREALRPFATAPAGSYRQREAAKILDAIRGR